MKYLIFSDMHGSDLTRLDNRIETENPDYLICLGDFDQTKTIHQFMGIRKKQIERGKHVVMVPGNHDHAILNGLHITSGTFERQGKMFFDLYEELRADKEAWTFINNLVNSPETLYTNNRVRIYLDKPKFGEEYQTMVIHGAYDGDIHSFPDCPQELRDLWLRLSSEEDFRKNFDMMEKKGYKVMIRGHDHEPLYTYKDPQKGIVSYEPKGGDMYRMFKHRRHVINPGALYDDNFAVIDTDGNIPLVRFNKI